MIASTLPELPWQKVGTDLFERNKTPCLLIVDYYSRKIARLNRTTAEEVIKIARLNRTTAEEVIKMQG